jgi:hypothetical protein
VAECSTLIIGYWENMMHTSFLKNHLLPVRKEEVARHCSVKKINGSNITRRATGENCDAGRYWHAQCLHINNKLHADRAEQER